MTCLMWTCQWGNCQIVGCLMEFSVAASREKSAVWSVLQSEVMCVPRRDSSVIYIYIVEEI